MSEGEIVPEEDLRCRCGSKRFISVSFTGGVTRVPQCVPCGRVFPGIYGYGSASRRWDDVWRRRSDSA